jgi:hypothetical protein
MRKRGKTRKWQTNRDAMNQALRGVKPLDEQTIGELIEGYSMAYARVKIGGSSIDDLYMLSLGVNVAMVLTERVKAMERPQARLDGEGLRNVAAALELHDAQITLPPQKEFKEVFAEILRRVESGNVIRVERLANA